VNATKIERRQVETDAEMEKKKRDGKTIIGAEKGTSRKTRLPGLSRQSMKTPLTKKIRRKERKGPIKKPDVPRDSKYRKGLDLSERLHTSVLARTRRRKKKENKKHIGGGEVRT